MGDGTEFERRIAAAFARIAGGLDRAAAAAAERGRDRPSVPPAPVAAPAAMPAEADIAALRIALDEERTANAQLEERLRLLRDRGDSRLTAALAERDAARARVAELDGALQGLRQSQAELREMAGQLRAALAEGVAEPDLVNRAMQAEIDALVALRAADAAEVDAVIAELRPLIEEGR